MKAKMNFLLDHFFFSHELFYFLQLLKTKRREKWIKDVSLLGFPGHAVSLAEKTKGENLLHLPRSVEW